MSFWRDLGGAFTSGAQNLANIAGSQASYNQAQATLVVSNAQLQAEYAKQAAAQNEAQNRMIVFILAITILLPIIGLAVAALFFK